MNFGRMKRVNKSKPCPVCGKPDWCLVAADGSAAICARISEDSIKKCADAGYLHILIDRPKNQQKRSQRRFTVKLSNDRPDRDFAALQQQYSHQITSQRVDDLSQQLGVSTQSLKWLNVGWDGEAYTFPMSNDFGKVIGIRRRFTDGCKVSVKGSKTGLFIPSGLSTDGLLLICEGPTDTAAALSLGFTAIGRPNCNSKIEMTVRFAKGRKVVIIGDNDKPKKNGKCPGKEGALKLAERFVFTCLSVRIIFPPTEYKDLRDWYRAGLRHNQLLTIIEKTKPLITELVR